MPISKTLFPAILTILCISIQGCTDNQQQPAPAKMTPAETKETPAMKYDIAELDSFTVMGTLTRVTQAEDTDATYDKIWKQFEPFEKQLKPLSTDRRYYGVDFTTEEKGTFDYLAGMAVHSDEALPDKTLVIRKVPAARYAVFKCSEQDIAQTYQYIFSRWLPESRYTIDATAYSFEKFSPKDWQNRPVFIHIPVVNK